MSDEVVQIEIWGKPDDNGGYESAVMLLPGDTVTQIRLESLGYIFWHWASYRQQDYEAILENCRKI